jgi:hypothetical protein
VKSFADPGVADDLLRRVRQIQPDSARRWGRMTAHQMVCHLRDTFLMDTEARPVRSVGGPMRQHVMRCVALYVPVRWPRGLPTLAEVDQEARGTRPAEFGADLAALVAVVEQARAAGFFRDRRHPALGPLTEAEWHRWAWLHTDHHLRQFGL